MILLVDFLPRIFKIKCYTPRATIAYHSVMPLCGSAERLARLLTFLAGVSRQSQDAAGAAHHQFLASCQSRLVSNPGFYR